MHEQRQAQWSGHLVLIAFGTIVLAFMGLSLAITATGTARLAAAMGYRAEVGYAVGGVFDVAKAPRPSGGLREALMAEKVPPDVWHDSQECFSIRGDKYFQKACAKVLDLRRELAASEDYERLDLRARGIFGRI